MLKDKEKVSIDKDTPIKIMDTNSCILSPINYMWNTILYTSYYNKNKNKIANPVIIIIDYTYFFSFNLK